MGRHGPFLVLLLLFVLLRLLQASCSLSSFDEEDGFTMSSAVQLLSERQWPFYAYLISDWEGDSAVVTRCRLLGPLPPSVLRRICPGLRASFLKGWRSSHCVTGGR